MQRPPQERIALYGQHLLPMQLQGVEAHRQKKRCYEASDYRHHLLHTGAMTGIKNIAWTPGERAQGTWA